MKTQIFKSWLEFTQREDKDVNGVSEDFALDHPEFEKENESNKGCWNCSRCSRCSDCSRCSGCSDCSRCSGCSDCSDCSGCSDCSRCSGCSHWKDNQPPKTLEIPVIENIHQKVLEAITADGNGLNMESWHTCETTHCRAGWVIHLAGYKGYELERRTDPVFAAMQIYKASSHIKVSPPRFFEHNETAMADIKRCAEEESKLDKPAN